MSVLRDAAGKIKDVPLKGWLALALLTAAFVALLGTSDWNLGAKDESTLEARLERVLSQVEGAGAVHAMVNEQDGVVTGVLIVAEGARDVEVLITLQNAVRTLLNIDNANIEIVRMEEKADEGR